MRVRPPERRQSTSAGESNLSNRFYQLEFGHDGFLDPHRFSGGVLALDAANTVVLRGDRRRASTASTTPRRSRALRRRPAVPGRELGGRALDASDPLIGRSRHRTSRSDRPAVSGAASRVRSHAAICGVSQPAPTAAWITAPIGCQGQPFGDPRHRLPSTRLSPSRRCRCCAKRQRGSGSARIAAGVSSIAAAMAAGSGATWRSAATAQKARRTIGGRRERGSRWP